MTSILQMNRIAAACVFAIAASTVSAQSTSEQATSAQSNAIPDAAALQHIVEWRRDFHEHPELSNREVQTSKKVADALRKMGYQVRTGIALTGVVATMKGGKPGPKLAIRADMDALPVTEQVDLPFASKVKGEYQGKTVGVMHACGHDAHMAMTLGVAAALAKRGKDLPGEVMFIFQPAEEGAPPGEDGGAPLMVKEGVFKDFKPDAIFGMHVASTYNAGIVGFRAGGMMASSDTFRITVHGRQAHGATPWMGIDPIVTAAQIVMSAQTIVSRQLNLNKEPAVLTFGVFDGGQRFNIIPDSASLQGTFRTFDTGMRDQAMAALNAMVKNIAAANGATVDTEIPVEGASNPVTYNDPPLTSRVRASAESAIGKDHVIDATRWTASEDFPHYGAALDVPSVYFFVGATSAGEDASTAPVNHSPRFKLDEAALPAGTAVMTQAALDFLNAKG
ncbi:MAG: amidohydrolase [Dokdonella sp.]